MTDIKATLEERGARYGAFRDHAVIAQGLQDVMRGTAGWSRLAPDQKQALSVIADKIARMLNGDPDYIDNWHDIIGYAKLVEDRLNERAAACESSQFGLCDPAPASKDMTSAVCIWIEWKGGDCPVDGGVKVAFVTRRGAECVGSGVRAMNLRWSHLQRDDDIVKYRVIA
jgi:hypothetical protein